MLLPSTPQTSGAQEIIRPIPKILEELRPFPKAGPRILGLGEGRKEDAES